MLTQASRLFIVFIMLLGFAQIEAEEIPKGIMPHYKRQVDGTGNPAGSTTSPNGPSSTPDDSSTPNGGGGGGTTTRSTPDNSNGDSGSTSIVRTTSTPTVIRVTTTNGDGSQVTTSVSTDKVVKQTTKVQNSFVTGKGTTINAATLTQKTVVRSPLVGSRTVQRTLTSFFTSDGVRQSTVYTTDVVVPTTTGFSSTTIAPSLADGGGSGGGLSGSTKAVIGGVVGGIGGAALVGAIVFVLWRLHSKKKQEDRYSNYTDKYGSHRESSMTYGSSEGYSSYGGRVNTASNF